MRISFSPEKAIDRSLSIEAEFIRDFMPFADGDDVKVYLYLLYLSNSEGDLLKDCARALSMDYESVLAAVRYWEREGLILIMGDAITFQSPRLAKLKERKYDADKYNTFNKNVADCIKERAVLPNESRRYYDFMESTRFEQNAMVAVVRYCVNLKGANVPVSYILTVARNLADKGIRTFDAVAEELEEYGVYYTPLQEVARALKLKKPSEGAVELYRKWTKQYKFDREAVIESAKRVKHGGFDGLDALLTKYNSLSLRTKEQIESYENELQQNRKTARAVNRALGVYYENTDSEIDEYILPWKSLGFSDGALVKIAAHAMKNDVKTLSALNAVVRDMFSRGIISEESLDALAKQESADDANIAPLLSETGAPMTQAWRTSYRVWKDKWNSPDNLILCAAKKSRGKVNPLGYMNALLSAWHERGFTDESQVDNYRMPDVAKNDVAATTDESELEKLFININVDESSED